MKNILSTLYITLLLIGISTSHAWAIDGNGSFISGGITRTFVYHAPGAGVATNLPVMIVMHGDGGSGSGIKGYAGFDAIADANNFIAVYPDADGGSWNRYADAVDGDAGLGNPDAPDDVLFISDLIDHLCENYQINPNKVYATGHSAGGFMAYNLAVQLPNKIAAFAPVAASLWGESAYINNYFANNYTAVPIMHIHGDNDNIVNYPDPNHTPDAWNEWPLSGFSSPNCSANTYSTVIDVVPDVKRLVFCNNVSPTNKEVYLIRIMGGSHDWPNVAGYNTAGAIWNFCSAYSLNTGIVCNTAGIDDDAMQNTLSVYPVPADDFLYINGELSMNTNISVMDISGKVVLSSTTIQPIIDISGLQSGIYFLYLTAGTQTQKIKFIKR